MSTRILILKDGVITPTKSSSDVNNAGVVDLTTNQTIGGIKTFSDTTQSTSTTTGGLIVIGGQAVGGNLNVGGFTSLGDNVAIKVKRILGVSAATQGGIAQLAHGINPLKVVGFQSIIAYQSDGYMLPNDNFYPGYQYSCFLEAEDVFVNNSATNSSFLLSKPVTIIIFYTA